VNYRRNPAAALLVEDGSAYEELRGLLIQGRAEVVDDTAMAFRVQKGLYEKYTLGVGPGEAGDLPEAVEGFVRTQAAKRSAVVVHAEKVVTWDHRKLAGVY
jgi:hypothetical protein